MIYSSKFCGLGHLKTKENTQIIVDSLLYQIIGQSIKIFVYNIKIDFTIINFNLEKMSVIVQTIYLVSMRN